MHKDSALIGPDQYIEVDEKTPCLNVIIIDGGGLYFTQNSPKQFRIYLIFVINDGVLQAGTEAAPFN